MDTGKGTGSVRIIGGSWRGRQLKFPSATGVRPTPDRVRETVFNWLGPALVGQSCLDLFAGSGAFGFEALSRGADRVVMIERDPGLFAALEASRLALGATACEIRLGDAQTVLGPGFRAAGPSGESGMTDGLAGPAAGEGTSGGLAAQRFGFVVVDPPFRLPVEPLVAAVRPLLAPGGMVYVERPRASGLPDLEGLRWHRRSRAGRVEFGLATRS